MANNKKRHYVPRFLLKRFSANEKRIGIYNITSRKLIPSGNLSNQCYKPYLYGKDDTLETALARAEGQFAELLRALDEIIDPPPPFSEANKLMLLFVVSQRGRTLYAAEETDEMFDKMFKNIFGEELSIDIGKFKAGLTEPAQEALASTLLCLPQLLDMRCAVLVNKTDKEFVISDNPVVFYNQLMSFRTFGSNCGFATKGLQVFFAIDPQKSLFFYDAEVYQVGSDNRNIVEMFNEQDVYELNTLQIVAALENIYFRDPSFKATALHKRAEPYLRKKKTDLKEFPIGKDGPRKSSLLTVHSEDVRTNLDLSFVRLTNRAKHWRGEFKKLKRQPAVVVRNKELVDEAERFRELVKKGEYTFLDFDKYMAAKMQAEHPA
jgi:hypothetical protein